MAELTKEMVLDVTKITKEVKEKLFGTFHNKKLKYAVIYLHHWVDSGDTIINRYGISRIVRYNNGWQQTPCVDFFETLAEAKECARIKPLVTNKKYTNVSIIER